MMNPERIAFSIGTIHVYWYGILMATGIMAAILLAIKEGKRKGLYEDAIIDMCLWAVPLGIVGARLYYVLFEWKTYAADPISALYIWQGGLALYGSLLGGMLGVFIFSRRKKLRLLRLVDCAAPGIALAQAIARWGNFFNQEAFGLPVTESMMAKLPLLQYFPFTVQIDGLHNFNGALCLNPYHLATFFYESLWCFLLFLVLWGCRKKFKHDGDAFLTYAMLYAFERMLVEGLRGDSLYLIRPDTVGWLAGGVRVSQFLSFLLVVGVGVFFLVRAAQERKEGRLMWPAPESEAAEAAAETAADGECEAAQNVEEAEAEHDEEAAAIEETPAEAAAEAENETEEKEAQKAETPEAAKNDGE